MWTAQQIAKRAGLTDAYVRSLLINGKIKGKKFGYVWAISDEEAARWLGERGLDTSPPVDDEESEEE
jgi:hypothetical protein